MIKIICTLPEKERLTRSLVNSDYCPLPGCDGACGTSIKNPSCADCINKFIEWVTPDNINFPNSEV